jgi:hypothetical protein
MSFQMANELKSIRGQILDLVKRIEALEDFKEDQKKRRPVLTMPVKTPDLTDFTRKAQSAIQK